MEFVAQPKKMPFIVGIITLFLILGLAIILTFNYKQFKAHRTQQLEKAIEHNTISVARTITSELNRLEAEAKAFMQQNPLITPADALQFLQHHSFFKEIDVISTNTRFAFIKNTQNSVVSASHITPQKNEGWTNPFFSENLNQLVIGYSAINTQKQAILYIFPLSLIQKHLISLNPLVTSLNFLIDERGSIVVHPSTHYVDYKRQRSIFDMLSLLPNDVRYQKIDAIIKNREGGDFNFQNVVSGQNTWIVTRPLPIKGWIIVGISYPQGVVEQNSALLRHKIFLMTFAFLIALCLAIILGAAWHGSLTAWWIASLIISLLCACHLVFLWNQESKHGLERHADYTVIADQNQLNMLVGSIEQKYALSPLFSHINFIPTGVFFEKVVFSRESNDVLPSVSVNGYIWQRYAKSLNIKPDFLLPDAFNIEKELLQSSMRGNEHYFLWRISCKLFAIDTFLTYPFDHRHINLRIMHPDFDQNTILIPDLAAYQENDPSALPGLSSLVSISNWFFQSSFFNYRDNHYNATLDAGNTAFMVLPQFNFSFICQRTLVGEFITFLILIILTLIFLFILLLTFSKEENLMGFTNLDLIIALSGLLFVLILSHISLRQALGIIGISYIEAFYFICYFLITSIAIDSTLFVTGSGGRFIQYDNNIIPKLLYWPLFFLLSVIATFIAFY
jgi:hypothetical protein